MQYLVSHVSQDNAIVRFRSVFTDRAVAQVYFIPEQIDSAAIHQMLLKKKLTYTLRGGENKEIDNPFIFKSPAEIKSISKKK